MSVNPDTLCKCLSILALFDQWGTARIQRKDQIPINVGHKFSAATEILPIPLPTVPQLSRGSTSLCAADSDYAGGILFVPPSPDLSPEEREDEEIPGGSTGTYGELGQITYSSEQERTKIRIATIEADAPTDWGAIISWISSNT
jgi:hypothetical protein